MAISLASARNVSCSGMPLAMSPCLAILLMISSDPGANPPSVLDHRNELRWLGDQMGVLVPLGSLAVQGHPEGLGSGVGEVRWSHGVDD